VNEVLLIGKKDNTIAFLIALKCVLNKSL